MALASPVDEAKAIISEGNILKFGFNLLLFLNAIGVVGDYTLPNNIVIIADLFNFTSYEAPAS